MKIMISGGWSYGNLGDEVIAKVTVGMMNKLFPDCSTIYTSYDPSDFERHHNIKSVESVHSKLDKFGEDSLKIIDEVVSNPHEFGLKEYEKLLQKSDVFLMSGGGYFTGRWITQFVSRIVEIELAAKLGLKVVILGQSIGPFDSNKQLSILKGALEKCSFINVRDIDSSKLIKSLLPEKNISVCCDIALTISDFYPMESYAKSGCNLILQSYARYVMNGVFKRRSSKYEKIIKRITFEQYRYNKSVFKLIEGLTEKADDVVNIVISVQSTSKSNKDHYVKYAKKIQKKYPMVNIYNNMSADSFIEILASGKYTISVKMHPLIVSASYGTEAFAISQHYKMDAFMKWLDGLDHCYKNNSDFSNTILKMIQNSDELRNQNKNELTGVIEVRKNEIYKMFDEMRKAVS